MFIKREELVFEPTLDREVGDAISEHIESMRGNFTRHEIDLGLVQKFPRRK